jgi:hypothetical protein
MRLSLAWGNVPVFAVAYDTLYHNDNFSSLEIPRAHRKTCGQHHQKPVHDDGIFVVAHLFCWVVPEDISGNWRS